MEIPPCLMPITRDRPYPDPSAILVHTSALQPNSASTCDEVVGVAVDTLKDGVHITETGRPCQLKTRLPLQVISLQKDSGIELCRC